MLWGKPAVSLFIFVFAAIGCGNGQQFLSLGTSGTGGIYYPLGGALASRCGDPSRGGTAG